MKWSIVAGAACLLAAPVVALDGQPRLHDPSTVLAENGRYYVYATGNGLPVSISDDGWTWRRAGGVMHEADLDRGGVSVPGWRTSRTRRSGRTWRWRSTRPRRCTRCVRSWRWPELQRQPLSFRVCAEQADHERPLLGRRGRQLAARDERRPPGHRLERRVRVVGERQASGCALQRSPDGH